MWTDCRRVRIQPLTAILWDKMRLESDYEYQLALYGRALLLEYSSYVFLTYFLSVWYDCFCATPSRTSSRPPVAALKTCTSTSLGGNVGIFLDVHIDTPTVLTLPFRAVLTWCLVSYISVHKYTWGSLLGVVFDEKLTLAIIIINGAPVVACGDLYRRVCPALRVCRSWCVFWFESPRTNVGGYEMGLVLFSTRTRGVYVGRR